MNRTEILNKANEIICKDRQATHGEAEDSFSDIANLWSAYLHREINPKDVAMMMVMLKIVRYKKNPTHLDNAIDLCGYAAIAGELGVGALE